MPSAAELRTAHSHTGAELPPDLIYFGKADAM
jgi:hypothetical protein